MNKGMLWFDNRTAPVGEKVDAAAIYYRQKYGAEPNTAYVNPKYQAGSDATPGGIRIKASNSIMPNHLWIGIEGEG